MSQVGVGLLADHFLFHVLVLGPDDGEDVELFAAVNRGHALQTPVIIDFQVVGNPHDPLEEFPSSW